MSQSNISTIILAAGASTRLGKPKQLVVCQDKSLIRHICDAALQSKVESVYVVLGSQISLIEKNISDLPIKIIENPHWQTGISSSIRAGIKKLPNTTDAALILLCDQPKVNTSLLNTIIDTYISTKKQIIACKYGDTIGVPALFDKSLFPELLKLEGDYGAKKVIANHESDRMIIDFPEGIYDIDSPIDNHE